MVLRVGSVGGVEVGRVWSRLGPERLIVEVGRVWGRLGPEGLIFVDGGVRVRGGAGNSRYDYGILQWVQDCYRGWSGGFEGGSGKAWDRLQVCGRVGGEFTSWSAGGASGVWCWGSSLKLPQGGFLARQLPGGQLQRLSLDPTRLSCQGASCSVSA